MNNNDFEKPKSTQNLNISSCLAGKRQLLTYSICKVPLFFNLFENRLIHSEFLKEVFTELLENKENIRYNFQTKIFSLYNGKNNFYVIKISLLQQTKITLGVILVVFLLCSFPYNVLVRENKNFFHVYGIPLLNVLKAPFSITVLLFHKTTRKLKIFTYIIYKALNILFFKLFKKLFMDYLQYRNFNLSSQSYRNLFTDVQILKLSKYYKSFVILWVSIFFKESIVLDRVLKRYNTKLCNT
uniref:hypothetical protein n=1 Tax=Chlorobotrys sp. TaxID=2859677 RepID=UPI0021823311|nr:hypothetical protein N4K87_pgp078 [Chlorobotrys sp.]UVI60839.1 hypothetical protein [Chlorobotrys sp.]